MKVNKQRLSNQVYDILKNMILNHRFSPGARINVEQIAKEVGASRTPVWEAVHRLMQEGLLENIPNKGVFMAVLTPKAAIEMYTVRQALEGLAAKLAAQNANEKAIKKMKACLDKQAKAVEKEDLIAYSKLDFEFHAIIYELSGNQTLQEMLEAIKNKMRPIAMMINPILPELYKHHLRILEAIKNKDSHEAEAAFIEHNQRMIDQIKISSQNETWKEVANFKK
ncbi:MAG: GntR family transcriptional regulator [Syntrophorhabdaceae bacterium]|nr:GntR family transcriptional regulator [Syntrophorhabdaceae bacterium]